MAQRGNVRVSITADTSGLQRGTREAEAQLSRLGETTSRTAGTFKRFAGGAGLAAATAGFASLGLAVSKMAVTTVDFDKSMRNVNSIAQLSEGHLQLLEKQVLKLAGKTAQAPKTLAEGLYDLVSSGFDAKESMSILASSAKAATAGLTTTEVSTKAVAAVLNAYHRPARDAAAISDTLFQTVNLGVISFETLASSIGDVLPFASSLGINLNQVGASLSTMTKAGLSGEEATTRLKNTMIAFIKPSVALAQAIKKTGFSSGESLIHAKGFQGALEAVAKTTDGTKSAMALLFPNIRALGGSLALTGKNAKAAEHDLAGFKDTTGATDKALSQQSKSISYNWNRAKAVISSFSINAGFALIKFGGQVKRWADDNQRTIHGVQATIESFAHSVSDVARRAPAAFATVRNAVKTAMDWIKAAFANTKAELASWKVLWTVLGVVATYVKVQVGVIVAVFRAAWPTIKAVTKIAFDTLAAVVRGGLHVIEGIVQVFTGLLRGDFGRMWAGVKNIFSGAFSAVWAIVRGQVATGRAVFAALGRGVVSSFGKALNLAHQLAEAMRDLIAKAPGYAVGVGKAIVRGIVNGIKSAAGSIGSAIGGVITKYDPTGLAKRIGDGVGFPSVALPSAAGAGNLMGARASLGPFAAVGAKFGLRVSSGRRPGAITSSGNTSYHASGEAIDEAGPPAGMLAFFKYMRQNFGSRLAELIFTPGGAGIKDGRPYVYTGAVAADHFDHVHVAFDTGKPGVGDGVGKFTATSYGPPWGGIQGGGVTATGVNLKGSPHRYGIAVDPSVLSLGKSYYVWPNPFGYKGAFKAFDTGGAIKGNRIDFYDWRGRKAQDGWGARSVDVSTTSGVSKAGKAHDDRVAAHRNADRGVSSYELASAQADVAIADAQSGPLHIGGVGGRTISSNLRQYGALVAKQQLVGARIRKVRAALKGKVSRATRLRLTQELSGLLSDHADLGNQAQAALNPAADTGSGDLSGSGGDAGDPNQPLIDAINAAAEQQRAHDELIKQQMALEQTIRDEQRKFNNVGASNYQVLSKAIADVASGQLGGKIGLGFMTPGFAGAGARY